MSLTFRKRILAAILIGGVAFPLHSSFAQNGRLREALKRSWIEKHQKYTPANASSDPLAKITRAGDYSFSIEHGGLTRKYLVHVPTKYQPTSPAPLLIALHGGGGNMEYQANDKYYGLISKSEKEGFVVAFPNGYSRLPSGKFATWNAGNCCGGARDENVDDVGFIKKIIDNLSHQLNIDSKKVFATGMSNGGMMSHRLACELAGTISAIAPVAGTDNTKSCNAQAPVSVLEIHAKNDDHVLFNGGAGTSLRDKSIVTDFTSVPETIAKWVKRNGCNPQPSRVLTVPGAYCDLYTRCRSNTQVKLCVTDTGGHSWPGGTKPRGDELPSKAVSADDLMWDFFMSKQPKK
ncbi:MAG: alpha/beta hydrolase family esterase [Bdellovibrionia bacterium]